jgi:FixJ family two-component response regulator
VDKGGRSPPTLSTPGDFPKRHQLSKCGVAMDTPTHDHANGSVAIVDDEELLCRTLADLLTSWQIHADTFLNPQLFLSQIPKARYDIVLLDVRMPEINGLDLIPEIIGRLPDVKIIVMTGFTDKDIELRALKLGAFDFVEKPFEMEFIRHTIHKALELSEAQRKQRHLLNELKSRNEELELVNSKVIETNRALTLFAQNLDREREEFEKRVAVKLRSVVIKPLEKIRNDNGFEKHAVELDVIIDQIEHITNDFSTESKYASIFTNCELRIASMIKAGMTSEEISDRLNISPATVKTHRRNIRKKMSITNSQYSLKNYLLSKTQFPKFPK